MSSHPPAPATPAHPVEPEPSDRRVLFSAIGWVGVLLLFGLIVLVSYGGNRGQSPGLIDADARFQIKEERLAAQQRLTDTYEWVNQEQGVVRIPLSRAMELTLRDYQNAPANP